MTTTKRVAGGVINYCHPNAALGALGAAGIGWPLLGSLIAAGVIIPATLPLIFDDGSNPSETQPGL